MGQTSKGDEQGCPTGHASAAQWGRGEGQAQLPLGATVAEVLLLQLTCLTSQPSSLALTRQA